MPSHHFNGECVSFSRADGPTEANPDDTVV
jgi:hypothetical protein